MSRRIECDKCGRDDLAPLRPERFAVQISLPGSTLAIDLCEKCARRLDNWCKTPDPQEVASV